MSEYQGTQAANGYPAIQLPVSDLAQEFTYTDGNITTATVVYAGVTYVQTFTYTDGELTEVSQWVPQP